MKIWTILLILIIIIGIVLGLIYLYYYHEKPLTQQAVVVYRNINLKIYDLSTQNNIISNYTISENFPQNIYKNGTSLLNNYILESLPSNSTFYITSNYSNITYYNNISQSINTSNLGPFKIDLGLIPRGNLTINYLNNNENNAAFDLTLNKIGTIENLDMCIKYSMKILALYNNNSLTEIPKIYDFNNYYKCYSIPDFNSSTQLSFNYIYFNTLDKTDYINFIFYDNDMVSNLHQEWVYNITSLN